ncbi:MAG: flagellin lysine-N-methylase [Bacillota bacterium]|nr:flagellin lysine-N-methylase [Bacillota bacterium]
MKYEYPSVYETFRCIGGACPDTCCAGWEVDIDPDTYDYYMETEGEFGRRLRSHMTEDEDGDIFFPLTPEGRCPFLNRQDLCDIFSELGEESLCRVCTEYPRYYLPVGDYEQIDMSLSCMEVGRLFFSDPEPVRYLTQEDIMDGDPISAEETARRDDILERRNEMLSFIQEETSGTADERFEALLSRFPELSPESDEELLTAMDQLELIDERWNDIMIPIRANLTAIQRQEPAFLDHSGPEFDRWTGKLISYFLFRYCLNVFSSGNWENEMRFIRRSLRFIRLMCIARATGLLPRSSYDGRLSGQEEKNHCNSFTQNDMIDIAHLYSKQVEHSDGNVELLRTFIK